MTDLRIADHAEALADYVQAGERRAATFGNRGPLRLDENGRLHPEVLDAYRQHGFYVFTNALDQGEVAQLRAEINEMLDRAPIAPGATVDGFGRPALGRDYTIDPYLFIRPLSDPWGGTKLLAGRHPVKMAEPSPDSGAPDYTVHLIAGLLRDCPAALRLYAHPGVLAIAEAINGADFVPYNDVAFVKKAGLGGAVSWHQDGATHWESPQWHPEIHGFNYQIQLYPTTAANGLWVVPGSHLDGKIDIAALIAANNGDERLPQAIPLPCEPGDFTIVNRQVLHGSFPNTSPDPRVSFTFGFHQRTSIEGVEGKLTYKGADSGTGGYQAQQIFDRSAVIGLGIAARRDAFPHETPYTYQPMVGHEALVANTATNRNRILTDYNTRDLFI